MAYVYRHIRLDKNEPFYIGIGSDAEAKYKRAYTKYDRNNLWNKIALKTKYEVEILIDEVSWDEACEKEKEFIKLYGRIDLDNGTLSNLTDGGEGTLNVIASPETRKRRSDSRKGEKNHFFGKHFSEEAKAKLREKAIKRTHTEEVKKIISEKNKGRKWKCKNPIERSRKLSEKAKGRPVSLELRKKHADISPHAHKICKYDENGKIIVYSSKRQIAKELGICKNISDRIMAKHGLFYPTL
jgi:hypothetical protein